MELSLDDLTALKNSLKVGWLDCKVGGVIGLESRVKRCECDYMVVVTKGEYLEPPYTPSYANL